MMGQYMRQPPPPRFSRRTPAGGPPLRPAVRRSPLPFVAGGLLALVLIWVLLLPPFSLLRGGGWQNAGDDSLVRRQGDAPKPPAGYQLAGPYYEIRSQQDRGVGPARITVPLGEGKGGRGLSLFTWNGGRWEKLAPAEVTADGRAARGEVDRIPANVAVMRRTGGGFQIQGILPPGAAARADAEPLLTVRSSADFVPAPDGSLIGAASTVAGGDTVAQAPIVRATGDTETQAVNAILAADPTRAAHVDALVRMVQTNKLDGVELEYTQVNPSLGAAFTSLVAALAEQLHKTGQTLTVTVPVPRREANNWNTLGYDLKELGKAADYLRIAPERDQSIYRRSMRDALNFITGQVDAKKLILTLSPLATEKSDQGIRTMSELEALSLASQITVRNRDRIAAGADAEISADNLNREGNAPAGLLWDATAAAVSFVVQNGDALRTVWIENAFSAAFKLEFVQLWGLGGVAVEDASDAQGTANLWPAIKQYQESNAQPVLLRPNDSLLRPQWLVDGKSVEVGKAVYVWKAPEAGEHTISLVVGDGVMRVVNQARVVVPAGRPATTPAPAASPGSPTPARR